MTELFEHPARSPVTSVNIPRPQQLHDGHQGNSKIEPERPVLDVPKVVLDTVLHDFNARRFPATAVDLRPAREARLYLAAYRIARNEPAIFIVMRERMRPRT